MATALAAGLTAAAAATASGMPVTHLPADTGAQVDTSGIGQPSFVVDYP